MFELCPESTAVLLTSIGQQHHHNNIKLKNTPRNENVSTTNTTTTTPPTPTLKQRDVSILSTATVTEDHAAIAKQLPVTQLWVTETMSVKNSTNVDSLPK